MKKTIKPLLTIYFSILSILSIQAQDCICKDAFDETVKAYEENYSLFIYKVTDENRDLYKAHTDMMREEAIHTDEIEDCKLVLEKWLQFFRDRHNYIFMSANQERPTYSESLQITESQFKKDFQEESYESNPLLGIWKRSAYTVAIIPSPKNSGRERDYVGVILESTNPNWKAGEVKFELTSNFGTAYQINFMMGDHSVQKTYAEQINSGTLEITGLGDWEKLWPEEESILNKSEIEAKYDEFHIAYIEDIPYLRLPDFYSVDRTYVDSLMKAHHENILKADFMVVDVRANGGGSDGTYFPVLPYLLDGPIELPANGFWLSEYNTQMIIKYKAAELGLSIAEYAKQEKEEYERYVSNAGTAYFQGSDNSWTFNADTLFDGPKKVIVLTDEGTGSSGETFVYRVNQSDKVVVYGQNTAGVVDGFNGLSKDIGCFEVVFPSSYRARDLKENPIDPYGIAPDVYVDEKEDVLAYAIEHMKHLIENEAGNN